MNGKQARFLRRAAKALGLEQLHLVPKGTQLSYRKIYQHLKKVNQDLTALTKFTATQAIVVKHKIKIKKGEEYERYSKRIPKRDRKTTGKI